MLPWSKQLIWKHRGLWLCASVAWPAYRMFQCRDSWMTEQWCRLCYRFYFGRFPLSVFVPVSCWLPKGGLTIDHLFGNGGLWYKSFKLALRIWVFDVLWPFDNNEHGMKMSRRNQDVHYSLTLDAKCLSLVIRNFAFECFTLYSPLSSFIFLFEIP